MSPPAKTKIPPGPGKAPTTGASRIKMMPSTSMIMRLAGWWGVVAMNVEVPLRVVDSKGRHGQASVNNR